MLQWTSRLSTGIDSIDDQHKELFIRVNAVFAAMNEGKAKDEVAETIAFLEEYIIKHFSMEEVMMTRTEYPSIASHKKEHELFKMDFKKYKEEFDKEGPTSSLAIKMQGWLSRWLTNHISKIDVALGGFLKEKL